MKKLGFIMAMVLSTTAFAQTDADLTAACKSGDLNAVKKAVEAGSNVNALRTDGAPIICEAMFWPEVTQYLLDKGADPNGGTFPAIMVVAGHYSYETLEVLLKGGADPNKPQVKTTLHPIAQAINTERSKPKPNKKVIKNFEKQLQDAGGSMAPTEAKTSTLENTINTTNCIKCVQLLIDYKADVNYKDAVGNDLLINSATRPSDLGSNFLNYGKMLADNWGYKVPSWYNERVAKGSSAEEIELLIKGGANVNYQNTVNNVTPLIAAAGALNKEACKILVQNGADVNLVTPNKKNILGLCAGFGDVELVKMIVEKGADVNAETWELDQASGQYAKGFTALTKAVVANNIDVAKYLIEAGCKPKEGVSGYHINPKTNCRYILTNKTAIYYAIENENLEMVKMLAENFKSWNKNKMTMKQPEVSSTVDYGNVSVETTYCYKITGSFTPSLYAKKNDQKEIASFLKSKGL